MKNEEIIQAIQTLSRKAKKLNDKKDELYESGKHAECGAAKTNAAFYYALKAAALEEAEKGGLVKFIGLTAQTFYKVVGREYDNYTGDYDEIIGEEVVILQTFQTENGTVFHLPNHDARKGEVVEQIEGLLPYSTKEHSPIEIREAVALIGEYIGEDSLVKCCREAAHISYYVRNFFDEVVEIFPEMKNYHKVEPVYYRLYPYKEDRQAKVIYGHSYWGLESSFWASGYECGRGYSANWFHEEIETVDWQKQFSPHEVAEIYATWAVAEENKEVELDHRKRWNSYHYLTDNVLWRNFMWEYTAERLNKLAGKIVFPEFKTREAKKAYFVEKFTKILEEGREITFEDFSLPEIDPEKRAAIEALYPRSVDIHGTEVKLFYYRTGDDNHLVAIIAANERERIDSMAELKAAIDEGVYLPSGLRVRR